MAGDEASALRDFLSLEAPFLLPHAEAILKARGLPAELLDRAVPKGDARELWPGTTASDASEWTRSAVAEQVAGWFRRRELRASLTPDERRELHRVMVLSRTLDERLKQSHRRSQAFPYEGRLAVEKGFRALGQEAVAGLALRLRRGTENGDIVSPLIRGLPLLLMFMDDPGHVIRVQAGKAGTPVEGRDFHVGDLSRGVLPPAAPLAIGVQTLVGMALAASMRKEDRVFLSTMGDGGTSLGEWHEAVNFAAVRRLPVVFVVENNRWALGTRWTEQTAAPRFAAKAAGYGIPGITVFGNDADETAAAGAWAAERARAGKGPTLIELQTYRRAGHAHHDDLGYLEHQGNPGYEIVDERVAWEAADPIALYEERLRAEGVLDDARIREARGQAATRVERAVGESLEAPWPKPGGSVWAPRSDPLPAASTGSKDMYYGEAIRDGISELMRRDPRVFVLGEDVGRYGGIYAVTRGLAGRFGSERCLDTPLAESAIIGAAVGAALAGMRPIAEMQFADFVACGFNALVNNAAKVYWRWGRGVPMVLRLPYGGTTGDDRDAQLMRGGPFHSQCPEAWLLRTPGLKIVAPSTPGDAKGLLMAASRDGNPVVYLEAKGLYHYNRKHFRGPVPEGDHEVPIGKAALRSAGSDVTLLSYGGAVWTCLDAATDLAKEGIDAEVIDLRSLAPLDEAAILESVAKTHRVVIVHEDSKTGGVGAELAAVIAEKAIYDLEAPILRVAAPDTPAPYAPPLELAYWPRSPGVVDAVRKLLE